MLVILYTIITSNTVYYDIHSIVFLNQNDIIIIATIPVVKSNIIRATIPVVISFLQSMVT